MGMTDLQFKDFLRGLMSDLQNVKKSESLEEVEEKVDELLERFAKTVED